MPQSANYKKLIRITTIPMALKYLLPGQMHFMSGNGFDVLMLSADGEELADVLQQESCRHIVVPMTRKITPVQDIRCLIQLIKIFRTEKPDIVHTHTPKAGLLGMIAAKICGVKTRIHTVAGLPLMTEKGLKYWILNFTERLTYACANKVWPNSPSLLRFIHEKKMCPPAKLNIIANGSTNGININRFNPKTLNENILDEVAEQINFSDEDRYLLCIGRLVADKGITELVNVFTKLEKTHEELMLILVGTFEDSLDPLPESILHEIEINPNIVHINWTDRVEYFMHLADFFVFPSHREGFPNVLLQAGAMGLPVVCSNIPGNIDIVTHNETGLVFDCGNEAEMLDLLEFALVNPKAVNKMAASLQNNIQENYQQEKIWGKMLEAYKTLVN